MNAQMSLPPSSPYRVPSGAGGSLTAGGKATPSNLEAITKPKILTLDPEASAQGIPLRDREPPP